LKGFLDNSNIVIITKNAYKMCVGVNDSAVVLLALPSLTNFKTVVNTQLDSNGFCAMQYRSTPSIKSTK